MADSPEEWALAALVVLSGAGVGWAVGRELGAPLLGALAGFGAGAATNYARGCAPCRRHVAEARAALGRREPDAPAPPVSALHSFAPSAPPADCPCRKGR